MSYLLYKRTLCLNIEMWKPYNLQICRKTKLRIWNWCIPGAAILSFIDISCVWLCFASLLSLTKKTVKTDYERYGLCHECVCMFAIRNINIKTGEEQKTLIYEPYEILNIWNNSKTQIKNNNCTNRYKKALQSD